MSEFLEWLISNLNGGIGIIINALFSSLEWIVGAIYKWVVSVFTDSYFSHLGESFFDSISNTAESFTFSFSIIYWVVGVSIAFYVIRHVLFPLLSHLVDNIHDTFTGS